MARLKPIAQAIDITEFKQAKKALLREKHFSETVINSSPGLLFIFDDKGNIIQWNRNAEKVTGYSAKEIAKMNILDFVANEDHKTAAEAMQEVLTKGRSSLEIKILSKPGKKTPFYITGLRTKFENTTRVVCTGINITEIKEIQQSLVEAQRVARVGSWEWNAVEDVITGSEEFYRLFDVTPEEIARFGQFVERLHPDDRDRVQRDVDNALRQERPYDTDYRVKLRGDGWRDINARGSTFTDADGKPVRLVGTIQDITERKRAQEALRQSETRYRTLFQATFDSILIADLETKIFRYANPAACRLLGYSETELTTIGVAAIHPKADLPRVMAAFEAQVRGDKTLAADLPCLRKDGTIVYVDITAGVMTIDGRECLVGFFRDSTERKQAEEALRESEERFRSVAQTATEGIINIDSDGNVVYWNKAAEMVFGYSTDEMIGQSLALVMPERFREAHQQGMRRISSTGESRAIGTTVEVAGLAKDGHEFPAELSLATWKTAEGVFFTGIVRDITERRQVEEALRKSEERYRTIIENIQDGYFEDDLAGKFTFVNDVICQHLGYTREELIGTDNRLYQDETNAQKAHQAFEEVYRTGEPVKALDMEVIRKDGTKGISEISLSLARDAQGKPIGFQGISRDITERKRAAEQLQRYATELERSNEEVKNFAYIVSHDLRVPLVNLKGYTSELRSALEVIGSNFDAALPHLNDEKRSAVATALHEDVPEALEFITNSVSRMDSFINAVLILARLGRQDLKPEPIDMNALLQTTVGTMSHQLQERGIEVIVGSLPHVVADRIAMEQIMGNILSNAVKYLDSSRPGRIEVTAQANGAETTFRIRDNGRGIAQEDMGKVFAPFRRAGKQDTPGEGMGLAYVQTLLRRHGGLISCESELGKGTTFTFTISTRPEKGARDA